MAVVEPGNYTADKRRPMRSPIGSLRRVLIGHIDFLVMKREFFLHQYLRTCVRLRSLPAPRLCRAARRVAPPAQLLGRRRHGGGLVITLELFRVCVCTAGVTSVTASCDGNAAEILLFRPSLCFLTLRLVAAETLCLNPP